jgi:predicted nuclease of predicted toxin-antitoxin system
MNFLVDEDVPIEIAQCLRSHGHNLSLVVDALGARTTDSVIWRKAIDSSAIIITCNRQDFLKLAGENPKTGLIILNRQKTRQKECRNLLRLIDNAGESGLRENINFA